MTEIMALATLGIALLGSYLAKKCKIPAAAMTGAILSVAIFNCITGNAVVWKFTKPCMQIMGGALLGHSISRNDLKKMKSVMKAAVVLVVAMSILNRVTGTVVYKITDMNIATALLATAPGGVSDMALIADEFGADMQIVSILQLFRMFGIYLIFPPVLRYSQKRYQAKMREAYGQYEKKDRIMDSKKKRTDCLITIGVAFLGGCLMDQVGIPAGFMVGSVAACAALNISGQRGYIPSNWRFYIQSITGAVIGTQMTKESVLLLGNLIGPVCCMICGMLLVTFLFGWIMAKVSNLDYQTSLLCLTPGGIQETSLLAADMGCDVSVVVVMHTIRLIVVICCFPMLLSMMVGK